MAILVYTVVRIFRKKGAERTKIIRDFKKGQCAIVYLPAIPLYWIGLVHSGEEVLPSFFSAVNKVFSLVVLRYDTGDIEGLMNENIVYTVAVYFCFVLVAANAMLFTLSFIYQKIWTWRKKQIWKKASPKKILILGNNKENLKIYDSDKTASRMILDDIDDKSCAELFFEKIVHVSTKNVSQEATERTYAFFEKLKEDTKAGKDKPDERLMIVVNTQDDEKNIKYCQDIVRWLKDYFDLNVLTKPAEKLAENKPLAEETEEEKSKREAEEEEREAKKNENKQKFAVYCSRIQVYVFGNPIHEDVYNSLVESSFGVLRYVNKYRQIAVDFINKYPLTEFMDESQIDVNTSAVKDGVDMNVLMIGFGKANKQIFLTSVANNQFVTYTEKGVVPKLVNYHIFDYDNADKNKNLNHSYYRYKNEVIELEKAKEKDRKDGKDVEKVKYLPLPAEPSNDKYYDLDINDGKFYNTVKSVVTANEKDLNYIIISFGTDLENVDLAQKLLQKKAEWKVENLYVFVKVRGGNGSYSIFDRDDCYLIGDEKACVYNINVIDDDKITTMAKMRNRAYAVEYEMRKNPEEDYNEENILKIYAKADYEWYVERTQFERESNVYACLSLRSKLHMMGLDYVEEGHKDQKIIPVEKDTYEAKYAADDKIVLLGDLNVEGKAIVKYPEDYAESRRRTMAIQEHSRWNAFMISKGFIPATILEIESWKKNGKDYAIRKHGNLTTFDGLLEFREIVAKKEGQTVSSADVIQYDYQLMDDAYWLLSKNKLVLCEKVKKSKKNKEDENKAENKDKKDKTDKKGKKKKASKNKFFD